jgi:hypothetical protein
MLRRMCPYQPASFAFTPANVALAYGQDCLLRRDDDEHNTETPGFLQ